MKVEDLLNELNAITDATDLVIVSTEEIATVLDLDAELNVDEQASINILLEDIEGAVSEIRQRIDGLKYRAQKK